MSYSQLREDKLLIDTDAPEPLPSVVKVVRAIELPSHQLLRRAGQLITLASFVVDQSLELADLLCMIAEILYSKAEGHSIGLVKHATATGTGTVSGSATATVIPPADQ